MSYVQRVDGSIVGAFARPQKVATEWVSDADPELVAFRDPPSPPVADRVESRINGDPVLSALVRRQAKAEGITERALLDEIRAEAKEVIRQ